MPYDSRAYRVLIASPSDVEEEREIAVKVIQEWNDLYSNSRKVVLLPLRWETHSAPEYGARPQAVINRAIVDQCDLLVGVFWTRVGTPTGEAESGTLEEIARVASAGKPIMLYFSKIGMDPDQLNLDQLDKLKAFKAKTYPNGLTESYKSHIEFRDKFARQLELKVRDLQREDASGQPPPLTLTVAGPDLKSLEGSDSSRSLEIPEIVDLDTAHPDDDKSDKKQRQAINERVHDAATVPVVLAIGNAGASGIRNLYVEMSIAGSGDVTITDTKPALRLNRLLTELWNPHKTGEDEWRDFEYRGDQVFALAKGLGKTERGWAFSFEWPALQPQRVRAVPPVYVTAFADAELDFTAKVFADSLPEPALLKAKVTLKVNRRQVSWKDLIGKAEH